MFVQMQRQAFCDWSKADVHRACVLTEKRSGECIELVVLILSNLNQNGIKEAPKLRSKISPLAHTM